MGPFFCTYSRERDARSGSGMTIGKAGMTWLKLGMIESVGLTAGGRAVWCPKGIAAHGI